MSVWWIPGTLVVLLVVWFLIWRHEFRAGDDRLRALLDDEWWA